MNASDLMNAGGKSNNTALRSRHQQLQQLMGQQKMSQMIHAYMGFEAILRELPLQRHHPCIINQYIQLPHLRLERRSKAAYALKRTEITKHELYIRAAALLLCEPKRLLSALPAATGHHDARAFGGQGNSGSKPHA
ncbi:hypothetical protein D3C78_1078620 [compost metagenome]